MRERKSSLGKQMVKRSLTLSLIFLCLYLSPHGQANPGSKAAALPDSTIGVIMREWFDAVNSGKQDEIRRFVETRFSSNAFRFQQTKEQYTAQFIKLFQQSDGLDIVSVTSPQPPQPISILAKSRRGGHFVRVRAGLDSKEKEKLAGMGIEKTESPTAAKLSDISEPLSDKRMGETIKRHLAERASTGQLSGVVLIAKDDKVLFKQVYGFADREARIANTIDTKFHIASVGKMFTAVAIAQLVRAGKLSFDDTVAKVIPEFPNKVLAQKVTIKQLLTHSAGMGTFFESPGFEKGKVYRNSTEEIDVYKNEKLFFEPGTSWRYSNAGYSLLGAVIERLSGKTYLEYIRQSILDPLGMNDTYTNSPGKPAPKSSVFYTQSEQDPLGLEPFTPNRDLAGSMANSLGGGFSTASDLFKFLRAYRTGKLTGDPLLQKIIGDTVNTDPKGLVRDGYGIFEYDSNGEPVRGHSGGSRTDVEMIWNGGYTIVIMTNSLPPAANSISRQIVDFITRQISLKKTDRVSPASKKVD